MTCETTYVIKWAWVVTDHHEGSIYTFCSAFLILDDIYCRHRHLAYGCAQWGCLGISTKINYTAWAVSSASVYEAWPSFDIWSVGSEGLWSVNPYFCIKIIEQSCTNYIAKIKEYRDALMNVCVRAGACCVKDNPLDVEEIALSIQIALSWYTGGVLGFVLLY